MAASYRSAGLTAWFLTAIMLSPAAADEADAVPDDAAAKLVEQLDAPEFGDRQEAGMKLAEMGKAALPALEKGSVHESREVAQRSFDLIKRLHDSQDGVTKAAAKESLKRLTEADHPAVARRAKDILEPKPATPEPGRFQPGGIAPNVIRVQAVAGRGRKLNIRNNNGVRDIESEEGDRKVKIHDDPNNGIQVEITDKKDGKEETKKFEAKNAEELKKNHPEAYKVFDEMGKPGQMKIEFGIAPGGAVVPAVPMPVEPAELKKRRIEQFDRIIEGLDRSMKQLQEQKQRIEQQKAELEKE